MASRDPSIRPSSSWRDPSAICMWIRTRPSQAPSTCTQAAARLGAEESNPLRARSAVSHLTVLKTRAHFPLRLSRWPPLLSRMRRERGLSLGKLSVDREDPLAFDVAGAAPASQLRQRFPRHAQP